MTLSERATLYISVKGLNPGVISITITTRTFLDGTLTVTLIPTLRPTLALLPQRLYRTSEAPLKLLHVYYNLTIYVLQHKPITTLRRLLNNVKDKGKQEDRQGAVYTIKCCDCQASYIAETSRNLSTRLTAHKRATRNGDVNNRIAEHHLKTKHQIRLGLCDMFNLFYRLLSTSYFSKLVN